MKRSLSPTLLLLALTASLAASVSLAKLPAPSDEAKAKAAEAAAKTAHGNKVADFQLCKSMDRVAATYRESAKKAGKEARPAAETPACTDPGAFVYAPASAAAPGAVPAAASPASAAATATAAAAPAKK
ncbi:hypothetical protein BurJ1DRAFT_1327 [Burkholderiales bacterium JOSHI_001]|nr:hypothetical protein BurJ1DRAFT_1327 [Burkholderiales bacterium JOSHI_001]